MPAQGLKLVTDETQYPRAHPRVRVLLSVKLITTTDEVDAKVRDLSLSGAMLQGRSLPKAGSDLIISRGSLEIFARVVWTRAGLCGVKFDSPLCALEELLRSAAARDNVGQVEEKERFDPRSRPVPLTAEELEIARGWAVPNGRLAYRD